MAWVWINVLPYWGAVMSAWRHVTDYPVTSIPRKEAVDMLMDVVDVLIAVFEFGTAVVTLASLLVWRHRDRSRTERPGPNRDRPAEQEPEESVADRCPADYQ